MYLNISSRQILIECLFCTKNYAGCSGENTSRRKPDLCSQSSIGRLKEHKITKQCNMETRAHGGRWPAGLTRGSQAEQEWSERVVSREDVSFSSWVWRTGADRGKLRSCYGSTTATWAETGKSVVDRKSSFDQTEANFKVGSGGSRSEPICRLFWKYSVGLKRGKMREDRAHEPLSRLITQACTEWVWGRYSPKRYVCSFPEVGWWESKWWW